MEPPQGAQEGEGPRRMFQIWGCELLWRVSPYGRGMRTRASWQPNRATFRATRWCQLCGVTRM